METRRYTVNNLTSRNKHARTVVKMNNELTGMLRKPDIRVIGITKNMVYEMGLEKLEDIERNKLNNTQDKLAEIQL